MTSYNGIVLTNYSFVLDNLRINKSCKDQSNSNTVLELWTQLLSFSCSMLQLHGIFLHNIYISFLSVFLFCTHLSFTFNYIFTIHRVINCTLNTNCKKVKCPKAIQSFSRERNIKEENEMKRISLKKVGPFVPRKFFFLFVFCFPLLIFFFLMGGLMTSFLPSTGKYLGCLLPEPGLVP